MIKKHIIFLFLAIAYAVLLTHNFTPHHHNAELPHYHHDQHHHDHHHNTAHRENENKEGDDSNPFETFDHIGSTETQYIPVLNIGNQSIQKKINASVFIKVLAVIISHFEKPPLLTHRAREDDPFLFQSLPYFFQLKAPPALFIA
jgi:hypothetical protein